MPRLSESMEEGTIVSWLKADGDQVEAGEPLVEIETDKATMIVDSPGAGTLAIVAPVDAVLPVGAAIARLMAAGEEAPAQVGPADPDPAPAPQPTSIAAPPPADAGADRPPAPAGVAASPVARRVAARLGVDLASVRGSGPRGRILKADVLQAAQDPRPPAGADVTPAGVLVPLSRAQQTIARRMVEAKRAIPDFVVATEVEMDAAVALRKELREIPGDSPLPSYNDMIVRACALGLREHPRANGSYRDDGWELHPRINIGIAVATEDSLHVPTVADADAKSLAGIATESRALAEAARVGRLTPSQVSGATFTVSNLGMLGITHFTAVVNPPQAAILAVGALRREPVARDEQIVLGWRLALSLSCDHRILYGADGAGFLAAVKRRLERPLELLT